MENKPQFIVIHHSDSSRDATTVAQINAWHKQRWPNFKSVLGYHVGYHKVILGSGQVVRTRNDNEIGAHTITADFMNGKSIGICLTGAFNSEVPSAAQLQALETEVEAIRAKYGIPKDAVIHHGAVAKTECCGKNLIGWLTAYKANPIKLKVAFVNENRDNPDIQSGFNFLRAKLLEFSGGKLDMEIAGFFQHDIEELDKSVLVSEEVFPLLKKLNVALAGDIDWLVVFHDNNMTRPWAYTVLFEDYYQVPVAVIPKPFDYSQGLMFECGHALIQLYNFRKEPGMVAISNSDNYTGTNEANERMVREKVQAVLPHLYLFDKEMKPKPPAYAFTKDIVMGERSEMVKQLQAALKTLGLFPTHIVPTGYYGEVTRKSVMAFQKKYSVASWWELLTVSGRRVGPKTREKLNSLFLK